MSTASKPATAAFALVTGASAGIGAIYADRLAKRGHERNTTDRNVATLETAPTRYVEGGGIRFAYRQLGRA